MSQSLSRRAFLAATASAGRGSIIALSLPMILTACSRAADARLDGARLDTLVETEAAEFEAIAARIIPTDETPGASEAGVIYFIDHVLGEGRDAELALLREGLVELQAASAATYGEPLFHRLDAASQDRLLTDIEETPFFQTLRFLTVAGMFALPEYGANEARIGDALIGFENRHVWQSPYGFYDADYIAKGE